MNWLEEAIQRLATPKTLRTESNRDFCKRFEIPESTYYETLSRPENQKRILDITLNVAKESTPDILEKLVELAKNGDIRAIDIYMDYILQLAKNLDIKTGGKPIVEIAKEIAQKNGINTSTESNS